VLDVSHESGLPFRRDSSLEIMMRVDGIRCASSPVPCWREDWIPGRRFLVTL